MTAHASRRVAVLLVPPLLLLGALAASAVTPARAGEHEVSAADASRGGPLDRSPQLANHAHSMQRVSAVSQESRRVADLIRLHGAVACDAVAVEQAGAYAARLGTQQRLLADAQSAR
jgi:hypothetical protein